MRRLEPRFSICATGEVTMAQEKILIVEDDDIFASYLEEVLTELGYAVLPAVAMGGDAIALTRADGPDLILMDVNLASDMDGIETARRIQSLADVPFIYLTGHPEASSLEKAKVTMPYGYLTKPVSKKDLSAAIEISLYRHSLDMKLKESEDRLKLALAASHMGAWERNVTTGEVFWSPESHEIFGVPDFDGTFASFMGLLHPEDAPRMTAAFSQLSPDHPLVRIEFRTAASNGEVRWLAGSGRGYFDDAGRLVRLAGTVQDITERKRTDENVLRLNRELRAISNCNQALLRAEDERTLLEDICRIVCDEAGYRMAWVGYAENDVAKTVRPVAWCGIEEGYLSDVGITWADTERGHGPTGTAIRTGQVVHTEDFGTDSRVIQWVEGAAGRGYRSSIALPLKDDTGKAFGALNIYSGEARAFIPEEIRLLEELSGDLAFGIMVLRTRAERKKSEEALRTSQLQLADAADMARIAYWEYDEATSAFIFNDAFYDLFGTTAEREGGYRMTREEHLRRFVHPDDLEDLRRHVDETRARPRTGGIERYEHRAIRGDGEVIYILTRNRVALDSEGRVLKVVGVNQDITGRKRAEEDLRTSRLQLAVAADMARIAYWEYDEATSEFTFNDAFYDLFGTTAEREGGYRMPREEYRRRFVHPDDLDELRRQVNENKARPRTDDIEQYEHRGVRRDGKVIHVLNRNRVIMDGSGRVLKVVGVNQDITDRKKIEDALRESETKLRAILDGSRDAISVSKDGIRIFANPATASLFGYGSVDELIGAPVLDVIAPESRDYVREMMNKRVRGEPVPPTYEATALKKDGSMFLMELTVSSYVVKGEEFALAVLRDISEKKRLEDQLRQAQKMEAVGTLAGGVAHDFNNILTVIMGLGNLMQMEFGKDDINRAYIDQIVASSERAADLTQSLLAFSRKQRITLEPHNVSDVARSTAKLLTRLLPEDIVLSMNLADGDMYGLLDVNQMGQVLMNLATNARDAMPHGGSLTVTTERTKIDNNFIKTHGFGRTGDYVKLSVSDTGIGMDESTVKRIFEPFFTTKEVGKGTGLGLASAYGIVKQHNGYITVSSMPFKGTTFDIYLPLTKAPSRQKARVTGTISGGTETILIVEDDRDVRNMLTKILSGQGYTTIEAIDGEDAIRAHHEHTEHIDLVILDVVMPGKNGKEILDEITRTDPLVKAIFISGYTGDIVIDKGIESESVDFLQKPLSITGLLGKVREVLDR